MISSVPLINATRQNHVSQKVLCLLYQNLVSKDQPLCLYLSSSPPSDYKVGFGGKFGVQTDRQDKSAAGWDHIEKVEKHESQVDHKKGFGGKYGVGVQDKSAVGWEHHEKVDKHESQKGSVSSSSLLLPFCDVLFILDRLQVRFWREVWGGGTEGQKCPWLGTSREGGKT